jgi:hypothetical protein
MCCYCQGLSNEIWCGGALCYHVTDALVSAFDRIKWNEAHILVVISGLAWCFGACAVVIGFVFIFSHRFINAFCRETKGTNHVITIADLQNVPPLDPHCENVSF